MPFLKKENNAHSTINQVGGLTLIDTELIVADASSFPTSGDFLITVWDSETYPDPTDDSGREIIKVTAVAGNTFTIERDQEDTVASLHANGVIVAMLITAGTFEEIEDVITGSGHVQNTDTSLDLGGANPITALEIPKALTASVDYYVDPAGNDSTGDGTSGNPFKTIQHAIDLLPKYSKVDNVFAQINVGAGTYNEFPNISEIKYAVYISGAGISSTTLNGYFTVKDCNYVDILFMEIINSSKAVYTERSVTRCRNLNVGGGGTSTAFIVDFLSHMSCENISDASSPMFRRFRVLGGSILIHDNSDFALGKTSGTIEGLLISHVDIDGDDYNETVAHLTDLNNPHAVEADQVGTDDSGVNVQEALDALESDVDDLESVSTVSSLIAQDIDGDLRPIDDYTNQGGGFELNASYELQPKLTTPEDLFFEYDINDDLIPKE